ncbi:hypothetical protein GGI04_002840, partial [Coemansia thaxteri]
MSTEEEGPAFISFNGLPDESVEEFVASVDSLRKHFKWSNQVTFCYARTMLKGSARKLIQGAKASTATTAAGNTSEAQQKARALSDEAIDPNSWSNLKSALVFEFSDQHMQNRLLVSLLSMRQQMGESSSEYAQRFVEIVSSLVAAHNPLDSNMLAVLFANGLRSEKLRWELLLRRANSIDKAIGYAAPDQLYKAAKLSLLISPVPTQALAANSAGELSPTSDASSTFAGSSGYSKDVGASDVALGMDKLKLDSSAQVPHPLVLPDLKYDYESADETTAVVRGSTANGASFSLDDDGDEDGDRLGLHPSAMPWSPAGSADEDKSRTAVPDDYQQLGLAGVSHWTPPRLPDARQRRQHRQSSSAYATPESGAATARGRVEHAATTMLSAGQPWTPTAQPRHATMPRISAFANSQQPASYQSYDLTDGPDAYGHARGDGQQQLHGTGGDQTPSKGSEADDQAKSATELSSLADQLEHLSSMLRVQSDARRKRPRLCYRCRQKGHMA